MGDLNFLRIWHDNSGRGTRQGWFLNYFAVRDVQTGKFYEFVCNNWLAVERADGHVRSQQCRLYSIANQENVCSTNSVLCCGHSKVFVQLLYFCIKFLAPDLVVAPRQS